MHFSSDHLFDLVVVGGGASGYMGAICAAEEGVSSILILESTVKPLEKVRISGGGRCNVTNATWDPSDLVLNYPRGEKELCGPFNSFSAIETVDWFHNHGVQLIAEDDGRMFPVENSSSSIIQCLVRASKRAGIVLHNQTMVTRVKQIAADDFLIYTRKGLVCHARKILLSTGGHPSGYRIASAFGHTVIKPLPSLFTLNLDAPWITKCSGIAVDNILIKIKISGKIFQHKGELLITHWGVSGPVVLKLTAFAARELKANFYRSELIVNWLGDPQINQVKNLLIDFRSKYARYSIAKKRPYLNLPRRLWLSILEQIKCDSTIRWAECSSKMIYLLSNALVSSTYPIAGKGPFGEEFVCAGGVALSEIHFATMESRLVKGLFLVGELLNVDGVTGGFNFQHCWTSGWLAGKGIARSLGDETVGMKMDL